MHTAMTTLAMFHSDLARGFAATDEKRRVHFEPTRCTFIHRER
jgi:hypothetical protein